MSCHQIIIRPHPLLRRLSVLRDLLRSSDAACPDSGSWATHYSGNLHHLNSSHAVQNVGWATSLAVCPDALAWSHIDSCLTTGQHGRRHCSCRLMPEPAQRHQTAESGLLLIGWDQGQKLRQGLQRPTTLCCSTSLMLSITLSAAVLRILISYWLIQIHSCRP